MCYLGNAIEYIYFNYYIMKEKEVFELVKARLIAHFPHAYRRLGLMCYEPLCRQKKCWFCYQRRPCVCAWEISVVLPDIEKSLGKKCSLNQPSLVEVVQFYADS